MTTSSRVHGDVEVQLGSDTIAQVNTNDAASYPVKPDAGDEKFGNLDRGLKSRHVQFLALSGVIGTGLFVSTGQVLSLAGPLSAFVAYAVTGFNLYCVINSLGEMAAWLPIPGAVPIFASRYVDPALGFTLGWNYWYQFAIGVPIEITACAVVLDYWSVTFSKAALITIFYTSMVLINCMPVRIYGEAEFVFGAIKLTTIVGLILLMFLITVGATGQAPIGFKYWKHPGPMNEYLQHGALGRFLAFFKVLVQATFSYGGSEIVVIAAGETENPRRNIPKAVGRVFWRIAIFYVLSIFLVGLCVSSKDPHLLDAISSSRPGAVQSPFVIAIVNAGIGTLPSIINGVILTSAWSAGNSLYYASTRMLYAAAVDGKAPAVFKWEKYGVPYTCVAATACIASLAYLNLSNRSAEVFFWFSNLSAVGALIIWASVSITYIRFHRGLKHHGINRNTLPYKSPMQPFLAYFSLTFCLTMTLFNGFDVFFPGKFSAKSFLPPYINIPIFASLFLGYKFIARSKLVPIAEMDLWTGKAQIDQLEPTWEIIKPRNWLEKVWFWIA